MKNILGKIKAVFVFTLGTMVFLTTLAIGLKIYQFVGYLLATGLWYLFA